MKSLRLALPLVALTLPASAFAQDVSGAVTLGFGSVKYHEADEKFDLTNVAGNVAVKFDNAFSLSVGLSRETTDYEYGKAVSEELDAAVAYTFANGAWVGAYYETITFGSKRDLVRPSFSIAGIEGGLNFGGVDLSAGVSLSGEVDSHYLAAQYAFGPFALAASYTASEIGYYESGNESAVTAVAGSYQFNENFGLFAGYSLFEIGTEEQTELGLGASYTYTGAALPVIASLEVVKSNIDLSNAYEVTTIRAGLTLPLGKAATALPTTSVAADVFNPRRHAVPVGGYYGFN